jgi:hypothetical protein
VRHHHLIHQQGWTLTRHPDGTLTFTDPTGHPSTWQPPTTITDYLPDTANTPDAAAQPPPASTGGPGPAPGNPSGSSPDIACQTPGRHVIRARIRPLQRSGLCLFGEDISEHVPFPMKHIGSRRSTIYATEISDRVSLVAACCPLPQAGRDSAATPDRRRQRFLCRFTRAPPHVLVIERLAAHYRSTPRSVTMTQQRSRPWTLSVIVLSKTVSSKSRQHDRW